MKKLILTIGVVVFIGIPIVQSQSLTPQVFASSGTHYTSASSQLSFTIGEPLTSSYTAGSTTVTQGFHQPEIKYAGIEHNDDFVFNVYPNPVQDYINITITDESINQYSMEIIDQLGQIIESKVLSGNNQQVDISTLSAGNYHLRITYKQNKTNSFTIIKTTNH